jgi:hypothetical protein
VKPIDDPSVIPAGYPLIHEEWGRCTFVGRDGNNPRLAWVQFGDAPVATTAEPIPYLSLACICGPDKTGEGPDGRPDCLACNQPTPAGDDGAEPPF